MEINIEQGILKKNEELAAKNREKFEKNNIFVLNIMSSPGAGKTTFTIKTIETLKNSLNIAVIEGDVASKVDAEKIGKTGVPVVQINTGGACHLDARMVEKTLNHFDLPNLDLIIIENVGNLVCPAEFNLGEHARVGLLSIPEGDDKPEKYPLIFSEVDVLIINKVDLLPLSDFDISKVKRVVRSLNPKITVFEVSCLRDTGFSDWIGWLSGRIGLSG